MDTDDIVDLYWARDEHEAYEIKGMLERAGIKAEVLGAGLSDARGELPMGPATSPQIWVPKSSERRARQLCAEWERLRDTARAGPAPAWTCPRCGERVEGHFDICWNCESTRPTED